MISLESLIREIAPGVYQLKNDQWKRHWKIFPVLLFMGFALSGAAVFFGWGGILTYAGIQVIIGGSVIALIVISVTNNGSLEFDCVNKMVTRKGKEEHSDFQTAAFDDLTIKYEEPRGIKRPDCIEFYFRGKTDPVYTLYIKDVDRGFYDTLMKLLREITGNAAKEEIADISPKACGGNALLGATITIGIFFIIVFMFLALPFAFSFCTNTGIGGFCMGLLGLVLFLFAYNMKYALMSQNWPVVDGGVVVSGVTEKTTTTDGSSSTWYNPDITYRYTVDGREYTGRTVAFQDLSVSTYEKAKVMVDQFAAGSEVNVFYKPGEPSVSTLITGTRRSEWVPIVILGALMLVAAYFAFRDWEGIPWEWFTTEIPRFISELRSR